MTNYKYFVVGFNGFNQFTNFIYSGNNKALDSSGKDPLDDPPVDISKQINTGVSNEARSRDESTTVVSEDNGFILRPMQLNVPDNFLFSWSSMFQFVFLKQSEQVETFGFADPKIPQLANSILECDFESSKEDADSTLQHESYVAMEYADCARGFGYIPFNIIKQVVNWESREVFAMKDDGHVFTVSKQKRNR